VPLVFWFEARGLRYGHFLIFVSHFPEPKIKKNIDSFFALSFRRKESAFSFLIWGSGAEIWPFSDFINIISQTSYSAEQKMVISQPLNIKSKSKGTFFSSILKVEE
jgi:hypothetical protein